MGSQQNAPEWGQVLKYSNAILKDLTPWDVVQVGLSRIRGGGILQQIAAKEYFLLWQPHDRIAFGMAATKMKNFHFSFSRP